ATAQLRTLDDLHTAGIDERRPDVGSSVPDQDRHLVAAGRDRQPQRTRLGISTEVSAQRVPSIAAVALLRRTADPAKPTVRAPGRARCQSLVARYERAGTRAGVQRDMTATPGRRHDRRLPGVAEDVKFGRKINPELNQIGGQRRL